MTQPEHANAAPDTTTTSLSTALEQLHAIQHNQLSPKDTYKLLIRTAAMVHGTLSHDDRRRAAVELIMENFDKL